MNSYVFIGIVTLTLLINVALAFVRRKGITFSVYAADPDRWSRLVVAITLTGTIVGGGMFLAVGQMGYEAGAVGFVLGLLSLIGLTIVGALAKKIRRVMDEVRQNTLIGVINSLYGNRVTKQFCLVNLFMYTFLLAGQFIAIFYFAKFVENIGIAGWIPWSLVGLGITSMFLYPVIGGLRKDIQTDIIQIMIILMASILLVGKLVSSGILNSMWVALPASHRFGTGYGLVFLIGIILFFVPSFLVRMEMWQRIKIAKTEIDGKRGFLIAAIVSCLFYFLFTTIGMAAYSLKLANSEVATLDFIIQQFQSPWLLGLIIGSFFAAVISTADTLINNASLFATGLVFTPLWGQKSGFSGDRTLLFWSRIFSIFLLIIALALSWRIPNFVDLLVGAFSLLLIYLPLIFGIFVKNWRDPIAVFWASTVALLLFLFLFFGWNPKLAFVPSVVLSIIGFGLIRAVRRGTKKEEV